MGLQECVKGVFTWKTTAGSAFKAMLTKSTYTLDKEAHDYLDDVSASRATSTTDQALTEVDPAEDAVNNRVEMDASNDLTYSSVPATQDVGEVIVYYDSTVASTSTLMSYNEFSGGDITCNGSDITVQFSADGVWALVYGA
jgi:hypothetical protein